MKDNFLKRAIDTHGYKYSYEIIEYKNINTKVDIICPLHGIFSQTPKNHIYNHGCPKCASVSKNKSMSKKIDKLIEEFKNIHSDKYDYSIVNYVNNKSKIDIICPLHGIFRTSPSHHLYGIGCSKCSKNYRRTTQEFILECNKIHNGIYIYDNSVYFNNKSKIKIICKKHGEFKQTAHHHLSGHGCPKCNQSKGENYIYDELIYNNIKFETQKTFSGCLSKNGYKLKYDFYLMDYNTCIEFDGIQHFKPIEIFGGIESLNKTKSNDKIKNEFCIENKINLFRISYNQKLDTKMKKIIKKLK